MKSVLVHGLLAVFGLGFAYQTWTRAPDVEEAPGAIVVADCREGDLQKMVLETETSTIQIDPKRVKDETLYWISFTRKVREKPKNETKVDGGVAAEPAKEEPPPKPKTFLANNAFKDYVKQLTPLRASQGLGTLPKDKLKDFGFDKVETTFELSCGGKKYSMEAGAKTFGTVQRYTRDTKSKATYLFPDTLISDLQSAQFKYMQTDMHVFPINDVEEVTVEVRGTTKKLIQRDRKVRDRATWVDASAPAKRNELYGNWINRVWKLKAREYLAEGAEPGTDLTAAAGEMTPVVRIDYKLDGKPNGKLEIVKVDVNGTPNYYARSEATRTWVTVFDSAAKEIDQDAAMVVGLEETPPSKAEPSKAGATDPKAPPHGGAPHALPAGHPPMPGNPHAPSAVPGNPHAPGAVPGNPHAPSAVPGKAPIAPVAPKAPATPKTPAPPKAPVEATKP